MEVWRQVRLQALISECLVGRDPSVKKAWLDVPDVSMKLHYAYCERKTFADP
jgi:hypothetical protein